MPSMACPVCGGRGEVMGEMCPQCEGAGRLLMPGVVHRGTARYEAHARIAEMRRTLEVLDGMLDRLPGAATARVLVEVSAVLAGRGKSVQSVVLAAVREAAREEAIAGA